MPLLGFDKNLEDYKNIQALGIFNAIVFYQYTSQMLINLTFSRKISILLTLTTGVVTV